MIIDFDYEKRRLRVLKRKTPKTYSFYLNIRFSRYNDPKLEVEKRYNLYDMVIAQRKDESYVTDILICTREYSSDQVLYYQRRKYMNELVKVIELPILIPEAFKKVFISNGLYAEPILLFINNKIYLTIKHPADNSLDASIEIDLNMPKIFGKKYAKLNVNFCSQKEEGVLSLSNFEYKCVKKPV